MANLLVSVVLALPAATVEVRDLTLHVGRHDVGLERQTHTLPARMRVIDDLFHIILRDCLLSYIVVGHALIPHTLTNSEGIADRRIEVLTIHEHVVARRHISVSRLLHPVAADAATPSIHGVVLAVSLAVGHIRHIGTHGFIGLCGSRRGRHGVGQQILRQVSIEEFLHTTVVEQWREEGTTRDVRIGV